MKVPWWSFALVSVALICCVLQANPLKITWQSFALIAVLCGFIVAWGNWKERTTKATTRIRGVGFIGLAALMLAGITSGNFMGILFVVGVFLYVVVGAKIGRTNSISSIQKIMFAGAVSGYFIIHSASHLAEAINHKGPGIVDFIGAGYGGGVGGDDSGDVSYEDDFEHVPESQYKQHEIAENGMMLGMGVLLWFWVVDYGKKFIPPTGNLKN